ncbi:DBH-LIKE MONOOXYGENASE [Salix koriyanagi]|uniref:DBH-LIKE MONOOXYGENASE n=1 Tax=Salix koriyanagi TaxID=2511006 RepID=A0A9Q1ANT6_9ROSI|nr:DBH-LIKE MONOOXYGENASE [Salix koriyanagi]
MFKHQLFDWTGGGYCVVRREGMIQIQMHLVLCFGILPDLDNQFLWSSQSSQVKSPEDEEAGVRRDYSMAVVPWVPSQAQPAFAMMDNNASALQTDGVVELMDFEEMGEATRDTEEDNGINNYSESLELGKAQGKQAFGFGGLRAGSDGFLKWPQEHCMMPQIAQNANPTSITWFQ